MTNLKQLKEQIAKCKCPVEKSKLKEIWASALERLDRECKENDERNYVEFERCQHDWSTTVHVSGTFGGPVNRKTSKQCKLCGVVG